MPAFNHWIHTACRWCGRTLMRHQGSDRTECLGCRADRRIALEKRWGNENGRLDCYLAEHRWGIGR